MVFVKMMNGFFECVVANPGTVAFKVSFVLPGVLPFTLITTWSVTLYLIPENEILLLQSNINLHLFENINMNKIQCEKNLKPGFSSFLT